MLLSACGMALKSACVTYASFDEARGKAIRKVAAMDIERKELFSRLDVEGVWYVWHCRAWRVERRLGAWWGWLLAQADVFAVPPDGADVPRAQARVCAAASMLGDSSR
jgi:hypothetical protein